MKNGMAFGKNAVGLLFPDGRRKESRERKGKKLDRERQQHKAQLEPNHLILDDDLYEHNGHERNGSITPPAQTHTELSKPTITIPSPPRSHSLVMANPSPTITPVFSNNTCISLNDAPPVDMNASILSFISARRRALREAHGESGTEESDLESGVLSMTSSTLFYNSRNRKWSVPGLAPEPGVGTLPPSPPMSVSPAPSAYSARKRHRSRLSQHSFAGSDSDEADYATADDHSPADPSPPVQLELDASTSAMTVRAPTPQDEPPNEEQFNRFLPIRRQKNKRRGLLATMASLEQDGAATPSSLASHGAPSVSGGEQSSDIVTVVTQTACSSQDQHTAEGLDAPAIISVKPSMVTSPSWCLAVPGSADQTERSGTFGYATGSSSGRSGAGKGITVEGDDLFSPAMDSPEACGDSQFTCGVEGPEGHVPAMEHLHAVPLPKQTLSPVTVPSADASSEAPASSLSPSLSTSPIPLALLRSRSPVQATTVLPLAVTGANVPSAQDAHNEHNESSSTNWFYHPTSSSGKRPGVSPIELIKDPAVISSDSAVTAMRSTLPTDPQLSTGRFSLDSSYNNTQMSATTLSLMSVNMSTSSFNSAGLNSLCPPSLSAVAGAVSTPRKRPRGPRVSPKTHNRSLSLSSVTTPPNASTQRNRKCSACHSESDCSSSEEDAGVLNSPNSPFDFSAPRPGFVPSPAALWSTEPTQMDFVTDKHVPRFRYRYSDLREEDEESSKRASGSPHSTVPQMSTSTSSHDDETFELQSPRDTLPNGVFESPPSPSPAPLVLPGEHPEINQAASSPLDVPMSQFARASFGCDGTEAEKQRSAIAAATNHSVTVMPLHDTDGEDSGCDSDLESHSEEEHHHYNERYIPAQVRAQVRADFFGGGSASARRARRSFTSVDSIPLNHEAAANDLSHLRTSLLPEFDARRSSTSVHTPHTAMSRQRSLNNLARKEEAPGKLGPGMRMRRSQSSPKLSNRTPLALLEEPEEFNATRLPSQRKLWEAATSFLFDEDGNVVCFGDLFPALPTNKWGNETIHEEGSDAEMSEQEVSGAATNPNPYPLRTIVFFIRSFWCGMCQDYTLASISRLDPALLKAHNISVAVVGPGHWRILKPYRELFKCPFPFYTDPTRKLYHTMGMTKYGGRLWEEFGKHRESLEYHQSSIPAQAAIGVARAVRHLPLSNNPGHLLQLGGEFILGAGYKCEFAHRMNSVGDHMEARDVLRHAGVDHPELTRVVLSEGELTAREELNREAIEASKWQDERDKELDRMRRKKEARRRFGTSLIDLEPLIDLEKVIIPDPKVDDDVRSEWTEYVYGVMNPKRSSVASRSTLLLNHSTLMLNNRSNRSSLLISKRNSHIEKRLSSSLSALDGNLLIAQKRLSQLSHVSYPSEQPAPEQLNHRSMNPQYSTPSATPPRPAPNEETPEQTQPEPVSRSSSVSSRMRVMSPVRKPVPILSEAEMEELRWESERLAGVAM